jgi:Na+/H+ antiporter
LNLSAAAGWRIVSRDRVSFADSNSTSGRAVLLFLGYRSVVALFENLVLLLFIAALLLTAARRLGVPYPTLLSVAGMLVALSPFAPSFQIEPHLALAIFIAPALLDAAFDTSPRDLARLWVPLLALAVGAVVATTAAVAYLGFNLAGLPISAAIALGAIVAPTDAVAANAVMREVGLPRHSSLVIQGESLLNDATALLLFGAATAGVSESILNGGVAGLAIAAPGGIVFGFVLGRAYVAIAHWFAGTLSSIIMQFTGTFGVWLLADRLHLSPVLAVVAYAMVIGQMMPGRISARDRVQSYSVWAAVVFVLNVLAFLFMGLQTRTVVAALPAHERWPAARFALGVLLSVIIVRIVVIGFYHTLSSFIWRVYKPRWLPRPLTWRATFVLSWCGTRGLLTLATSFALPQNFPGRNLIVLSAMSVVLGTLIIQGVTLEPLIRWLGVADDNREANVNISRARMQIIQAGIVSAESEPTAVAMVLKKQLQESMDVARSRHDPQASTRFDAAHARAVAAQRSKLHDLRGAGEIDDDVFHRLEEELDWLELAALPSNEIEVVEG